MEVSTRIITAAEMVTAGGTVADIGCDHCLSLIYLVKKGICKKGIGTDIRPGPLKKARDNIIRHGLTDKIELRLGDGLSPIREGEADAIIIAGMGGSLINDILSKGQTIAKSALELVLQPHIDAGAVRKSLHNTGYKIVDEQFIKENDKYYVTLKALQGDDRYDMEAYYLFGKINIDRKSPVLAQYLRDVLNNNYEVAKNLTDKSTENCVLRLTDIEKMNTLITEVLLCLRQ